MFQFIALHLLSRQNNIPICEQGRIRDFRLLRLEVDKKCALLGSYTTSSGNSLLAFQDNLSSLDSWPLKMGVIDCSVILCFVDRASLYNLVNKTNWCTIYSYYIYIYESLHVSGYYGPIIRRYNCVYGTLGTCYSVWTTSMQGIPDSHPHRITQTQLFLLWAHHKEKQLCLCDTWYLLFCVD
jgi:hypothetical protein